ncbi:hypothetical protein ACI3ET_15040 [Ornithinimicrobium sp. LYQ121]|uniref:hypothetical protein n=1 Tax=Ornithinimicrobium sp. LYQ121 TaxID=3378801 RepID=UPI0038531095
MSVGSEAAARALHLISEVQAFGLASAAAVAERYIQTVDGYLGQRPRPGTDASDDDPAGSPLSRNAERMVRAGSASFDLLGALLVTGEAPPATGGEALDLPPTSPGGRSQASAWVHNPTTVPVWATVRVSSLGSSGGYLLPPGAVEVEPAGAAYVDAGGSAEITVRILVPQGTPPEHFHALVTSTSTPRQALPLHLEVLAGER